MKGDLTASDNSLPRDRLPALATLLKEALAIQQDLAGRLARHPKQRSLLLKQIEYRQLVERLCGEFETALAGYLRKLKALYGAAAGTGTRPSGRASGARRRQKKRTSSR